MFKLWVYLYSRSIGFCRTKSAMDLTVDLGMNIKISLNFKLDFKSYYSLVFSVQILQNFLLLIFLFLTELFSLLVPLCI